MDRIQTNLLINKNLCGSMVRYGWSKFHAKCQRWFTFYWKKVLFRQEI